MHSPPCALLHQLSTVMNFKIFMICVFFFFFYVAIDSVSTAVLLVVLVRAGRLHQFGIIFSLLTKFLRYRSHSLDCRVMPKQKQTQNGLIYASESLVRFCFCVSRTSLAGWERDEINSHKVRNLSKFCKTFAAEAVKLCIIKLLRKLLQGEGPIDYQVFFFVCLFFFIHVWHVLYLLPV